MGHWNRTHCARGHQLTDDNIMTNSRGHRKCKTCFSERQKRSRKQSNISRRKITAERSDLRARLKAHVQMERDYHYSASVNMLRGNGNEIGNS